MEARSSRGYVYIVALISSVAMASLALLLVHTGGKAQAEVTTDPVLVGAGDVHASCTSSSKQTSTATAALLANISGSVFNLGDGTNRGSAQEYQDCYGPTWGAYKDRTQPAAGNHDYALTPGASGYFDYFGAAAGDRSQGYYSYEAGTWHVVVLNSNCSEVGGCDAGSPQEQWLEADLAAHPTDCTLAYWHHPRFSSGIVGSNRYVAPFWEDLYKAGADVVLNGHDHAYERFAPQNLLAGTDSSQGIREFVVGTGGGSFSALGTLKPNSEVRIANTLGVLRLTLHPQSYDWNFVKTPDAAVADAGTGSCHAAPADNTPPVTQPPSQEIPVNSTLGTDETSTLPVKLSWTATDAESGIVRSILEQSTDGGTPSTQSLTTLSTSRQLQPDSTYQFRVKATDGAGNRSRWTAADPFVVDPEQEASAAIGYAGSWTRETSNLAYGGGSDWSATNDSTARFAFSGSNVAWVATQRPDAGRARVSIDGVVIKTVDLYASTSQPRKVIFSKAGLDPAVRHTITVQVLGTKSTASSGTRVDVDAFVALH